MFHVQPLSGYRIPISRLRVRIKEHSCWALRNPPSQLIRKVGLADVGKPLIHTPTDLSPSARFGKIVADPHVIYVWRYPIVPLCLTHVRRELGAQVFCARLHRPQAQSAVNTA